MKYEVLKNYVRIGLKEYMQGDTLDHFDGYPWDVALHHGAIKIADGSNEQKKTFSEALSEQRMSFTKDDSVKTANVTKAGPWFKVLDKEGKIIGKATRDEREANEIKEAYEKA